MLLQSTRHKAQLVDISETQRALQTANARLENLARTDPLTELPNRRHFDELKENEFRRARRTAQPLSLLICDIDFFKGYNDTYGHTLGDQCLCAVAGALRTSLRRAGDMVARIGGEEFAILLPATTKATALTLAEYFRQAVADLAIPHAASSVTAHVTIRLCTVRKRGGVIKLHTQCRAKTFLTKRTNHESADSCVDCDSSEHARCSGSSHPRCNGSDRL
ncbi:MAG: diguanylate cyclase [Rhodoferax sp.]|nr:diguanylate cyclase [Rhodoferax sp.]